MAQPVSASEMSTMIAGIYDAAIDPSAWPRAMEIICDVLGFATGVVSLISLPDGKTLISETVGFDQAWLERFPDYEPDLVALWGGEERILALPLDLPAVLSSLNPEALTPETHNRFHLEFNMPQGFIDAIAVGLSRDDTAIGNIGFNRHRAAGPIGDREIEAMELLIPHLQRAARIGRLIDAERMLAKDFARVLDGLSTPVFLVAEDLRLAHANRAADDVLADGGVVRVIGGRLRIGDAAAHNAVSLALGGSTDKGGCADDKGLDIPLHDPGGQVSFLQVLPVRRGWQDPSSSLEIVGAIFMSGPAVQGVCDPELAMSLFGLSRAEEKVFAFIGGGQTIAHTATALNVGASTVKTHLLRIFEKTGTHRQAELVRLYESLRLPRRASPL